MEGAFDPEGCRCRCFFIGHPVIKHGGIIGGDKPDIAEISLHLIIERDWQTDWIVSERRPGTRNVNFRAIIPGGIPPAVGRGRGSDGESRIIAVACAIADGHRAIVVSAGGNTGDGDCVITGGGFGLERSNTAVIGAGSPFESHLGTIQGRFRPPKLVTVPFSVTEFGQLADAPVETTGTIWKVAVTGKSMLIITDWLGLVPVTPLQPVNSETAIGTAVG